MTRKIRGKGSLSNRQKTWIWIIATTLVVFGLLYWEQIALLYVLATVSVTVLLLVVAVADLGESHTPAITVAASDATLSIDGPDAVIRPVAKSTFGSRPRKNRR